MLGTDAKNLVQWGRLQVLKGCWLWWQKLWRQLKKTYFEMNFELWPSFGEINFIFGTFASPWIYKSYVISLHKTFPRKNQQSSLFNAPIKRDNVSKWVNDSLSALESVTIKIFSGLVSMTFFTPHPIFLRWYTNIKPFKQFKGGAK